MVSIRRARVEDLHMMQHCNLQCLPENYLSKYYFYHFLSWPQLLYVAEDVPSGKIVGQVLAKIEEEAEESGEGLHGHITSISVLRSHRKLGLANKLMKNTHQDMEKVHDAEQSSLHVRVTNRAAMGLYHDKLGYIIDSTEDKYYADGEDAHNMRKQFKQPKEKKEETKEKAGQKGKEKVTVGKEEQSKKEEKKKDVETSEKASGPGDDKGSDDEEQKEQKKKKKKRRK